MVLNIHSFEMVKRVTAWDAWVSMEDFSVGLLGSGFWADILSQ